MIGRLKEALPMECPVCGRPVSLERINLTESWEATDQFEMRNSGTIVRLYDCGCELEVNKHFSKEEISSPIAKHKCPAAHEIACELRKQIKLAGESQ